MRVRVTAHMEAPLVLAEELHLDGLLASAHPLCRAHSIGRHTPASALIQPPIPVASLTYAGATVALASVASFPDAARLGASQAVSRRDADDVEALARPVHLGLGPGKNKLHTLPLVITPSVTWRCVGDRRGIIRLVKRLSHLGSWRSAGYGQVRAWEVVKEDGDPAEVLVAQGDAQRTLPVAWTTSAARTAIDAIASPYWHPARRMHAVVPPGAPCVLLPLVEEMVHGLADPATQRAHRERHEARAAARRAVRDASVSAQA